MSSPLRGTAGEGAAPSLRYHLITDLCGVGRGRASWLPDGVAGSGVGWVPVNQVITPTDDIAPANPWGSHGDRRLAPDPSTEIDLTLPDGQRIHACICNIVELDGSPWDVCARTFLQRVLTRLEEEYGLRLFASFEHEFWLTRPVDLTIPKSAAASSPGFSFARFMAQEPFGSHLMNSLAGAGLEPEMFLPEFAPEQFEMTLKPAWGVAAADRAVWAREITRASAAGAGYRASFTPIRSPGGIGSGVHIHFSLWDLDGNPVLHDPAGRGGLSALGAAFVSGLVRHMPALCALTAASVISYERLQPHRWSSAYTCVGERNREATLRICPVVGQDPDQARRMFNLEWRATDATANPYLALGAILSAGFEGIRQHLPLPALINADPSELSEEERRSSGVARLPSSLRAALAALRADDAARAWFPKDLLEAYLLVKETEIAACSRLATEEVCGRYESIF
jgi:glutamine synthetase